MDVNASTTEVVVFSLDSEGFSALEKVVFLSLVVPLIVFTLSANAFVICTLIRHHPFKILSNVYLVSLALTDLLTGLLVMPLACYYTVVGEWMLGGIACKAWTFTSFFLVATSIFHLCAIAADRCRAINYPIRYAAASATNKKSCLELSVVWIGGLVIASPPFIAGWGTPGPAEYTRTTPCTIPQDSTYATYATVFSFYLPLLLIVCTYTRVFVIGRARFKRRLERSARLLQLAQETPKSMGEPEDVARPPEMLVKYPVEGSKRRQFLPHASRLSLNHPSHGRCRGCKANLVVKFCAKAVPNDPAATDSSAAKEDATASTSHARSFSVLRQEAVDVVADVDAPAKKTSTVLLLSDESRGLCQVCRVPNDLLTAAQRSRMTLLLRRERRSLMITTVIVSTFVICWMPAFTLYWLVALFPSVVTPDHRFVTLVWWLAYANSACNPIIYTVFNRSVNEVFRVILKKTFRWT